MLYDVSWAGATVYPGYSGNTYPVAPNGVDGHVNFMVFELSGVGNDPWGTGLSNFISHFTQGTGSPGLDTTADYLYLFQTVNDHTNTLPFSSNSVSAVNSIVTSWGYFNGVGFTQNGVLTKGSTAADLSGGVYLSGASGPSGDPAGKVTGDGAGVALDTSAIAPTSIVLNATSLVAYFNSLPNGSLSMLWGYTSNVAPDYASTSIGGRDSTAQGTAPTMAPEPATIGIWLLLGLLGGGFTVVQRKRRLRNSIACA
jgi:hypothetical protein